MQKGDSNGRQHQESDLAIAIANSAVASNPNKPNYNRAGSWRPAISNERRHILKYAAVPILLQKWKSAAGEERQQGVWYITEKEFEKE